MTSRFTSFVGKTVKSGSKVTGAVGCRMVVQSTKDKFLLSKAAAALLGVTTGSTIVLLDKNLGGVATEDNNDRYFITKGYENAKGVMQGAKLGAHLDFSYSSIWGAIINNDPAVTEIKPEDLIKSGKAVKLAKSGNVISLKKVEMDVKPYAEEDGDETVTEFEIEPGVIQPIFLLTNLNFIDHDTKADVEEAE